MSMKLGNCLKINKNTVNNKLPSASIYFIGKFKILNKFQQVLNINLKTGY